MAYRNPTDPSLHSHYHYSQQHKPGQSSKTTFVPSNPHLYNQPPSYPALFNPNADYAHSWWLNQQLFAPVNTVGNAYIFSAPGVHPAFHQESNLTLSSVHANVSDAVPPSPTDVSSNTSESGPSPGPEFARAVCNAPLVAPVPLPYHSPTFLQFDLPDDDEDLSHPPYVSRPHKRKRESDETDDDSSRVLIKRQATPSSWVRRHAYLAVPTTVAQSSSHSQYSGWAVPVQFGGNPFPG